MKKWRQVLAGEKSEPKLMVGFKRYKTDNDVELPNAAEFSGDKDPSKTGDSAKQELDAFKEGNKLMQSDKKREDKTKGTSSLMGEDVKRKDMAKHISEEKDHVKPSYANKKTWRKVLGDVSFKNKPDGTVQIDITSHPNEPMTQNPTTQQPGAMSPEEVQQQEQQTGTSAEASLNKESFVQPGQRVKHISSGLTGTVTKVEGKDVYVNTDNGSTAVWGFSEINTISAAPQTQTPAQNISQFFAGAKKWEIKKEGNLSLTGAECKTCAGIQIEKDGKVVESYMVNKDGHEWREMISEGVWASKFDEHLK